MTIFMAHLWIRAATYLVLPTTSRTRSRHCVRSSVLGLRHDADLVLRLVWLLLTLRCADALPRLGRLGRLQFFTTGLDVDLTRPLTGFNSVS